MMSPKWISRVGAVFGLLVILSGLVGLFAQNTAGIIANQDTDVRFTSVRIGSGGPLIQAGTLTVSRCMNIDPTSTTTDWLFLKAPAALTVKHINCISDAATSTILTLRACDANGASCSAVESAITCTTSNSPETGAIDTPAVTSGSWLRVLRGTMTGSVTQAVLCVDYTVP